MLSDRRTSKINFSVSSSQVNIGSFEFTKISSGQIIFDKVSLGYIGSLEVCITEISSESAPLKLAPVKSILMRTAVLRLTSKKFNLEKSKLFAAVEKSKAFASQFTQLLALIPNERSISV